MVNDSMKKELVAHKVIRRGSLLHIQKKILTLCSIAQIQLIISLVR